MAGSRVRPITASPPGAPSQEARAVIDQIRGVVDGHGPADGESARADSPDPTGPEEAARRAADLRHVAVAALAASDEAVARAHDVHGATWTQLGHALGLAASAVPRLRARHRAQKQESRDHVRHGPSVPHVQHRREPS